jgi:NitT/TauT family transport system ATP-binding protein
MNTDPKTPIDTAPPADAMTATATSVATSPSPSPAPSQPTVQARPAVVEFRNVTKTFDGEKPFTAIKNVTFKIEDHADRGEFVCILGPSGCGKSTVLRTIAGLTPQYPQTSGEALVFGRPVAPSSSDRGMVFQDYSSFDHRTVLDNIAFGLECQGMAKPERHALAMDWIGKVGLSRDKDALKYPHQLSGGMRQRVAIARTLILKPRIILMDEPFGALDPATRLSMQDLLLKLWHEQQASVFFITHDVEEAVFLSDQVLIMSPAPGTILEQRALSRSLLPARAAQREAGFLENVFALRDVMEKLEQPR